MKKVTFSITVVVLLAMIVGLIGYDRFSTSQNAKKYQLEEKTTTTTKEETTKTKTKRKKIVNVFIVLVIALPWEVNLLVTHLI